MITIEKGIPLPPRLKNGPTTILRQMEIGDSIVIAAKIFDSYRTTASRMQIKLASRKIPDQPDKLRVWRLT